MNYNGNMPEWHQFNASQTSEVTSATQNVNSGHLAFIPGINPSLNAINLSSETIDKHQSASNYNPRHYQPLNNVPNGPNISNNAPLASMVQMQNCIGHYGSPNTRNPIMDNMNSPVDPRNTSMGGITDDIGYRNNQMPFNGPIAHLGGSNCNINTPPGLGSSSGSRSGPVPGPGPSLNSTHGPTSGPGPGPGSESGSGIVSAHGSSSGPAFGSNHRHGTMPGPVHGTMGPQTTNVGSVTSGRPGISSFIPCKGLCCNSDPNINYQQWEKYGPYQTNTSYRDNVHSSGYQVENRHFRSNSNLRKDNFEGKETLGPVLPNTSNVDHRRNFIDYKYHKDHLVSRNYSTSGMVHNYSMQNYNYTGDYQKYPYPITEHPKTNNMNILNSGILKHQEQNFIPQQKFNNKQFQYQNGNLLPKVSTVTSNPNMMATNQNSYFNSQLTRSVPTEVSHECQESTENIPMANRMQSTYMHGSHSQYQVYQQKIAMQKFSMENHLRELSRIPGYQSHPKYKECILKYREILKLQQSSGYQNQIQQSSRAPTPVKTAVPPINLQFDQNGILINSNYLPDTFPKLQHVTSTQQRSDNIEKHNKNQVVAVSEEKHQETQQSDQITIQPQNDHGPSHSESFPKQNQYSVQKDCNQNQLKVSANKNHAIDHISSDADNHQTITQQTASKEFANKPDLDVRQFLANWDETDDEEGTVSNLTHSVLTDTTPVVVVSYENIDLSEKPSHDEGIPKQSNLFSNETFDSDKKDETKMVTQQDCLTVYSSPENAEIIKTSERTITEGVVKPGSIIHCISNGPDEIPTIHIVDNLEINNILGPSNDQVVETLRNHKTISFFKEKIDTGTETTTLQTIEACEKDEAIKLCTQYDAPLDDANKKTNANHSNVSEDIQPVTVSINNQELRVLSISPKSNLESTENLNLKKQNSFINEELHNPDDISLPDLPTSECTPISTTLNTPIHSDGEDSTENIGDLTIPTNPIEIMQNSPVISFTQSPVTIEPYGQLSNDEIKSKSVDESEDMFQEEDHYKDNNTNDVHEQDIGFNNFNLSTSDSNDEPPETTKCKQTKNPMMSGKSSSKKCVNESLKSTGELNHKSIKTSNVSLDLEQSAINNNNLLADKNFTATVGSTEELHYFLASEQNLTQSDRSQSGLNKIQEKKELNSLAAKTSFTSSEIDSDIRSKEKENSLWENQFGEEHLITNFDKDRVIKVQKQVIEQLKNSDRRKLIRNDLNLSQSGEQFLCHKKTCTSTVIKDNISSSGKELQNAREISATIQQNKHSEDLNSEKSSELQLKTSNTKDFFKETELKKHVSSKLLPSIHIDIHPQNYGKSELLQKDLKLVDNNVNRSKEEVVIQDSKKRNSKVYYVRGEQIEKQDGKMKLKHHPNSKETLPKAMERKDALQNVNNDAFRHENKKIGSTQCQRDKSLVARKTCLEEVSSTINQHSDTFQPSKEEKGYVFSKNFIKNSNSDIGIHVANVNLQIKDSENRKELILGDKTQEHTKDSLDRIKIEINVSCTELNSKGDESYNRKLCLENCRKVETKEKHVNDSNDTFLHNNETCSNSALDCQCCLPTKELEMDNSNVFDKSHELSERTLAVKIIPIEGNKKEDDLMLSAKKEIANHSNQRDENDSLEANDNISTIATSQEMYGLSTKKQLINNTSSVVNLCLKDKPRDVKSCVKNAKANAEIIEDITYSLSDTDILKGQRGTSNTVVTDENMKVSVKTKSNTIDLENNCVAKIQTSSTGTRNSVNTSLLLQSVSDPINIQKYSEKEGIPTSYLSNFIKKSTDGSLAKLSAKSLSSRNNLDFNLEKLDYKKYLDIGFNRVSTNESADFDDNYKEMWKKPKMNHIFKDCDAFESTSGYINPIFLSIDKLEDLHTVPVYTTKDGKISYSPNRKFTYHELMMEARKREGSSTTRKSYYIDTLDNYSSKLHKLYKKKRHHLTNERKKYTDYKDKGPYERRRSCFDGSHNRNKYKDLIHTAKNYNTVSERDHIEDGKAYNIINIDDKISDCNKDTVMATDNQKENCTAEGSNDIVVAEPIQSKISTSDTNPNDRNDSNNDESRTSKNELTASTVHETRNILNESSTRIESCNPHIANNEKNEDTIISKPENLTYLDTKKKSQEISTETTNNNCSLKVENNSQKLESAEDLETSNNSTVNSSMENHKDQISSNSEDCETVAVEEKQMLESNKADHDESTKHTESCLEIETINSNILKENVDLHQQFKNNKEEKHTSDVKRVQQIVQDLNKDVLINISTGIKNSCVSSTKNTVPDSNMSFNINDKSEQNSSKSVTVETVDAGENAKKEQIESDTTKSFSEELICLDFSKNDINNIENNFNEELKLNNDTTAEAVTVTQNVETDNFLESHFHENDCDKLLGMSEEKINEERSTEGKILSLNMNPSIEESSNDVEHREYTMERYGETKKENNLSSFDACKAPEGSSTCNTNVQVVPKFVIKKTETLNSVLECSLDYTKLNNSDDIYDPKLVSNEPPKIPKMIITKNRSRSVTPSIDALDKKDSEGLQSVLLQSNEVRMDTQNSDAEIHVSVFDNYKNKIPKVKIKLEDMSPKNLKLCLKRKNIKRIVPKMKIKRIKSDTPNSEENKSQPLIKYRTSESTSKLGNTLTSVCKDDDGEDDVTDHDHDSSDNDDDYDYNSDDSYTSSQRSISGGKKLAKLPKLKLKKQEDVISDGRKRKMLESAKIPLKRVRQTDTECSKQSAYNNFKETNNSETKSNAPQCISGKIPKVIIKRSQVGAEFKCEISRNKKSTDIEKAKWQPKVQLQRLQLLDHMVTDLKQSKITLTQKSLLDTILMNNTPKCIKNCATEKNEHGDTQAKLSRSSSTSNLSPIKCKQRRLSDYDYTKAMDTRKNEPIYIEKNRFEGSSSSNRNPKDITSKSDDTNNVINSTLARPHGSETKHKHQHVKKGKEESSFDEIHVIHNNRDKECQSNIIYEQDNIVVNERDIPDTVHQECFDSDNDESESDIEDMKSDNIVRSHSFQDKDTFVIEVDSSDESQTTIEILPASPDISQGEIDGRDFENDKNKRSCTEDAIPTQLELELELMNQNGIQNLDVTSQINQFETKDSCYVHIEKYNTSHSGTDHINEGPKKAYNSEFQHSFHSTSSQDKYVPVCNEHLNRDVKSNKTSAEKIAECIPTIIENTRMTRKEEVANEFFYCNDLLVQEVLAAKETLKKCLGSSEEGNKSRPKTAAEKKQGLSFNYKNISETVYETESAHRSNEDSMKTQKNYKCMKKKKYKTIHKCDPEKTENNSDKQDKDSTDKKDQSKNSQDKKSFSVRCSTASTCTYISVQESTTISLKASKQFGQIIMNEDFAHTAERNKIPSQDNRIQNTEKPNEGKAKNEEVCIKGVQGLKCKDQKQNSDSTNDVKMKEDNMPLLVPEVTLNFDSQSDRDSSRSPPVITDQNDMDNLLDNTKDVESKIITSMEETKESNKHSYKDCEMTIADIITQLAYHEKATIKHKRYCNLCERWFPTMSRHRQHLAGYQHRYIELTQRKSIHALFILFTGKPCPKLLPANIVRNDCSVGELTPLQIAVQDIAKCVEYTQPKDKKEV